MNAVVYNIEIPYKEKRSNESKKEMAIKAAKFKVKEFIPDESEAKEIKSLVDKEENKGEEEEEEKLETADETDVKQLMEELGTYLKDAFVSKKEEEGFLKVEEFEKDIDSNFHIDFISSISNLRCVNYQLKEATWLDVKLKAGKIIPALATTTAAVAGMQTLELLKLMKCEKLEEFRNYYLNLALPFVQGSECGEVKKLKLTEGLEVDLWTRWDIRDKTLTLRGLFDYIQEKYKLYIRDVMVGTQPLFLQSIMNIAGKEKEKEETLNSKIIDLTESLIGEHIDLNITCTVEEEGDKIIEGVPPVRIYFEE